MERRQEKIKKLAIDLVVDVLGGLMLAIAIYSFAVPANFPMTGVSGIALVFYHLFGLPVGTVTVLLNIPIIICCYKTLGRSFYMKSLKTTLLTSAVMDLAGPQLPVYQGRSDPGGDLCRCAAWCRLCDYFHARFFDWWL